MWRFWALSVLKRLQLLNRWSWLFVPVQGFDANQFLLLVTVTLCLTGVSYGRQTPASASEEITTLICVCKLIFTWPQLCHLQWDASKALISPEAALTSRKTSLNHMTSRTRADGGKMTTNRSRQCVWEQEWNGKKGLTGTTKEKKNKLGCNHSLILKLKKKTLQTLKNTRWPSCLAVSRSFNKRLRQEEVARLAQTAAWWPVAL